MKTKKFLKIALLVVIAALFIWTFVFLYQRIILGFGIADDDVILRDEEGVCHFTLGREGFTGTGRTQDQPVGVLELLAVNHDHVVGQRVQPVERASPP